MRAGSFNTEQIQEEGRASGSLPVSVHCVEVDLSAQGFIKDKY